MEKKSFWTEGGNWSSPNTDGELNPKYGRNEYHLEAGFDLVIFLLWGKSAYHCSTACVSLLVLFLHHSILCSFSLQLNTYRYKEIICSCLTAWTLLVFAYVSLSVLAAVLSNASFLIVVQDDLVFFCFSVWTVISMVVIKHPINFIDWIKREMITWH